MNDVNLPDGWAHASIDDLIGVRGVFRDGDWVESKDQDPEGDVRLVQLADIGDGEFRDKSSRFLTSEKAAELNCTFLQNGDILVARMPDPLGRACLFPLQGEKSFVTVVDVCVIRFSHHLVDEKYFMHILNSPTSRRRISDHQTGSTRKRISRGNLSTVMFPIAPLNEQHRIVAKIEELFSELDKGIENLKTAREQLKMYRQALLKHAFEGKLTAQWREERRANSAHTVIPAQAGIHADQKLDPRLRGGDELCGLDDEPLETAAALLARIQTEREQRYQQQLQQWQTTGGSKPKAPKPLPLLTAEELAKLPELPEGWGWVRPEEICVQEPYSIGIGPFGSNLKVSDYRESGIPLIFVKNITRSNFLNDLKYIDEAKYKELTPHSVKALDLLITKMGDPPGDCKIYPEGSPNAVLTADCLKFRLWDEYANRKLYQFCINSNFVKRQLGLITKGVAQKKISVERFKTICLPLFSVKEQNVLIQELELKLSEADQLDQTIATSLQQAKALRQSILKKAFSGKLVPQDPHDEPASALLANIKTKKIQHTHRSKKSSSRSKPNE